MYVFRLRPHIIIVLILNTSLIKEALHFVQIKLSKFVPGHANPHKIGCM